VQQALLKLIEGTMASVLAAGRTQAPEPGLRADRHHNILFNCGGAFAGLEKVIEARTESSA